LVTRPQSIHGFVAEACVYLRQWCQGNPPGDAARRLLEAGVAVAEKRTALARRLAISASKESISKELLTRSLLGRLFLKSGPDSELARALGDDLESDDVVLYGRFESVVYITVSQELAHRWPESDPYAATLNHSLRCALRRDARLQVFPAGRAKWVILRGGLEATRDLKPIGEGELLRIVVEESSRCKCLSELAHAVLEASQDDGGATPAVEIELLHAALVEAKVRELALAVESPQNSVESCAEISRAAAAAGQIVIDEIRGRLDAWVNSDKIDQETRRLYERALGDVVEALRGGDCDGFAVWEWLSKYQSGLTFPEYRQRYRSFEYLFEAARSRFCLEMRRLLK
jgi:hypothetical protein